MMALYWALAVVAAQIQQVYSYPAPGACSGSCQVHDPSLQIRASDGKYFLFSTHDDIEILTASSLTGPWTIEGSAITGGSSINLPGNDDLWAPDVHYINGTYYMYYSVSTFGSQQSAIGVATSTTMDSGHWVDHGSAGVSSSSGSNYNAIDPNLIQISNGVYQLNFGSFWSDIYEVRMSSSLLSTAGTPAGPIDFAPSGSHALEGSFMYYYGGYYYLFASAGQCCGFNASSLPPAGSEYHVLVCRSKSSTSGFVDSKGTSCTNGGGTLVLASHDNIYAPGGQGVYNDPVHGYILYYHYINKNVNYDDAFFGWNKIDWSTGWPVLTS